MSIGIKKTREEGRVRVRDTTGDSGRLRAMAMDDVKREDPPMRFGKAS